MNSDGILLHNDEPLGVCLPLQMGISEYEEVMGTPYMMCLRRLDPDEFYTIQQDGVVHRIQWTSCESSQRFPKTGVITYVDARFVPRPLPEMDNAA